MIFNQWSGGSCWYISFKRVATSSFDICDWGLSVGLSYFDVCITMNNNIYYQYYPFNKSLQEEMDRLLTPWQPKSKLINLIFFI